VYILRTIIEWGWSPILITVLAVLGLIYGWPSEIITSVLVLILVMGMLFVVWRARQRQQEQLASKLRQLAGYFSRRFLGDSTLSIFTIIDGLFNVDNPQVWEWARACDMSKRVFNTWSTSFLARVETDARTGRFSAYLPVYLNELWMINNNYYDFVEQFYEAVQTIKDLPQDILAQYNRFVMEYNGFVQNFRDSILYLKQAAGTQIESPTVRLAREISLPPSLQDKQREEEGPAQARHERGYYR
jgi:hypothetical protein